jgi:hypothetical protein
MRHLLAALLVLLTFGCSVLDSGDRDELMHAIASMPPSDQSAFKTWFMNERARKWLAGKDRYDQVMKIQCREKVDGQWGDWYDRQDSFLTVAKMLACLVDITHVYLGCGEAWGDYVSGKVQQVVMAQLPADTECR